MLFGATGDLAQKKILPALQAISAEGVFSVNSRIVGVSRRDWDDAGFIQHLSKSLAVPLRPDFEKKLAYAKINLDTNEGYVALADRILSLKKDMPHAEVLIYLSLAPQYHPIALQSLLKVGLVGKDSTKLLLEKPFGTSEKTAHALNDLLAQHLDERHVYRIDHYLSKAGAERMMTHVRKAQEIKSVRVLLLEEKGIDGRGESYDGVGAFRDVGQNHMLEMVAIALADTHSGDWQAARASVIRRLVPPEKTCIDFRRGQYVGYLSEKGVKPGSETETAFKVVTMLDKVLITLESGKAMNRSEASVTITYRDGRVEVFDFRSGTDAYETMIKAALVGSMKEFVGKEEVIALWNYADHAFACWDRVPLEIYSAEKPFLIE